MAVDYIDPHGPHCWCPNYVVKPKVKGNSLFGSVVNVNDRALISHQNDNYDGGYNDYVERLVINEVVYSSVMAIQLRRHDDYFTSFISRIV